MRVSLEAPFVNQVTPREVATPSLGTSVTADINMSLIFSLLKTIREKKIQLVMLPRNRKVLHLEVPC